MYAFVRVKTDELPDFDDQTFALDLLEQKHVLLAPGTSFNVPYRDHFRTTLLPDAALLKKVFARIDELLATYASRARRRQAARRARGIALQVAIKIAFASLLNSKQTSGPHFRGARARARRSSCRARSARRRFAPPGPSSSVTPAARCGTRRASSPSRSSRNGCSRTNGRAPISPIDCCPPGAEWACMRELRREAGGAAEARALLNSVRTLFDWRIAASPRALGRLAGIRAAQRRAGRARAPVGRTEPQAAARLARRAAAAAGEIAGRGRCAICQPLQRDALRRLGARDYSVAGVDASAAPVAIATAAERRARARTDRRLVPRRTRTRSRTAAAHRRREAASASRPVRTPAVADAGAVRVDSAARRAAASTVFAIEGGRPLAEFPADRACAADACGC